MKNKIKYFVLYPLMLLIVILTFTYDVKELVSLGVRIPFGSSYWKDSLNDAISTNKSIKLGTGDSLYYNGVVVTSGTGGGGIAASDNISFSGRNTTSDLWTFNDSAKFTRIVNMDSVRVSGNLYQGTSRRFTAVNVNYNLENGFEWQNLNTYSLMTLDSSSGLVIRRKFNSISDSVATNSKFYFDDTVKTNSRFIAGDLARFNDSLILSSYDIFPANGKGFNWLTAGVTLGLIYSNAGELINKSNANTTYTLSGNFLNSSDSSTGFLVRRQLEGYADTVTSASKWVFSDIVTFSLSPVFSALVNFANGITTTTFYASGYSRQGELSRNEKKVTKAVYINTTNATVSVNHGISRVENVTGVKFLVKHDTTGATAPEILPQGYNFTTAQAVGHSIYLDSLKCYYFVSLTSYGLIGDSAIFEITYTDNF